VHEHCDDAEFNQALRTQDKIAIPEWIRSKTIKFRYFHCLRTFAKAVDINCILHPEPFADNIEAHTLQLLERIMAMVVSTGADIYEYAI
jgi:hypothetical protein